MVLLTGSLKAGLRLMGGIRDLIFSSCNQRSTDPIKKGRIQGHLTFVDGSDEDSSADNFDFDVIVAPFLLDSEP